jgi:hypothetical protein
MGRSRWCRRSTRRRQYRLGGRDRGRCYRLSEAGYSQGTGNDLHLRVKDTCVRFNNRHSAIEGLDSEEGSLLADHGSQVQTQLLRVHVGLEFVGQALLLAWCNLDAILLGSQVADDARSSWIEVGSPQASSNKLNVDGFGLFVAEGEDGFGGLAVDKLDAKDFGVGKGGGDEDVQAGTLVWGVDFFIWELYRVSGGC